MLTLTLSAAILLALVTGGLPDVTQYLELVPLPTLSAEDLRAVSPPHGAAASEGASLMGANADAAVGATMDTTNDAASASYTGQVPLDVSSELLSLIAFDFFACMVVEKALIKLFRH